MLKYEIILENMRDARNSQNSPIKTASQKG